SAQVLTTATGRSWLMCAFMPARANWIGSNPVAARRSTSRRQALADAPRPACAPAEDRVGNGTPRVGMDARGAKNPWPIWAPTVWVTARYIRLKQARPSPAGRPAPIASMHAIASATDVTGAMGVGGPSGMATLYGSQVARPWSPGR